MASNKSLKKFCKLSKYIEQSDPNLFEVFDDLCIMHLLKPARGMSGITFLYPKEKAYRQKIISAAYSTNPEMAVTMIKALILQDYYPNFASFGSKAINLLNQKLVVDSVSDKALKLAGGLELTIDPKFIPMGYRENMNVFFLSGKGEMPTTGPTVAVEQKVSKSGGSIFSSNKTTLQKIISDTYMNEIGKVENIYVKKVYLQLKCLSESKASDVKNFLGNDEFSDSYLLDMYCELHQPDCFVSLIKCFTPNAFDENISKITKSLYVTMKETFCDPTGNDADLKDSRRLDNILSPMEIRMRVFKLYNDDKERIGKDLFIVFCNICRDLWNTDPDPTGAFKNFAYLVANVYTKCSDIVKQEFDIPRDLTLYGNLLKSDVFHYVPQASFDSVALPVPTSMPTPLDMGLYSLCAFVNVVSINNKSGGASDPSLSFLLGDL